jgi:NADH dehydrogenase
MVTGDVASSEALHSLLEGADAVIYNIGILREFPAQGISFQDLQFEGVKRVAGIAMAQGIRRFILMSANGVQQSLTTYQRTKLAAEAHVQGLDLDWTVFRPSVIFGDPQGHTEFASMLKQQIVDPPLPIPLFHKGILPHNAGGFTLSPVHVNDVSAAFVGALEKPETVRHTYTLGGPHDLSWKQILSTISEVSGKRKLMLPVPAAGPGLAASLLDRYTWFPISHDQIRMLLAGNTCSGDEIFKLCGITPKPFSAEHLGYLTRESETLHKGSQTLHES